MGEQLIKPKAAAEQLSISRQTLLDYARAGLIASVRINARKILFRQSAISDFITSKETKKPK